MKSYALIGLACVAAKKSEEQEALDLIKQEKMTTQLNGFKGFYDGYYRSFYKVNSHDEIKVLDDCLNDKTINNIVAISEFVNNPLAMFELKNL
mgnify:CR=1 FL=1